MFNFRRLLAFLILLSSVVLTVVIYHHLQQRSPKEILSMLPENIDLAVADLHYTQNENGQRRWTLDADNAEYERDSGLAKLTTVKLLFYDAGAFGELTLTSEDGQLEQETRQVDVWGDVQIESTSGEQLFTERLHYDDQLRQLSTDEPIHLLSADADLTGVGLRVEIDRGQMIVKDKVRVIFYPAGREKK
jgi:LPS export ABC transporter protein LptC